MTPFARFRRTGSALAHSVAPATWRQSFVVRPADAIFVPAIKVGIASSSVLVVGGSAGHEQLAGIAALGALTSAFGRYQPYRRLAAMLAVVAAAMLIALGAGALLGAAGASIGLQIAILSIIAASAAHVFSAFRISGPGAVILIFAAAAGSGYAHTVDAVPRALTAMGIGIVVGWLTAMAPVLVFPLGPARLAAARAIAAVLRVGTVVSGGTGGGGAGGGGADGSAGRAAARAAAQASLGAARESLALSVSPLRGGRPLSLRLQQQAGQLHVLLDEAAEALELLHLPNHQDSKPALDHLARSETQLRKIRRNPPVDAGLLDTGFLPATKPPGLLAAGWEGLRSRSTASQALRIAGASALSGWAAVGLGFDHPLWASMGAVAALQGLNYAATVQRSIQRLVGNVVGAAIAVGLLSLSLGFWPSVLMVIVLQFLAEMLVLKNYTLTTIAVTPMALIMTGLGTHLGPEAAFSRVADTVVGVVVGVVVAALSMSLADHHRLSQDS